MKLVAGLIARNERGRYLGAHVEHLLEFVDEIRVLDDSSDDGTLGWLGKTWPERVLVATTLGPSFFEHEGRARNQLLEWTMQGDPTHILALDADEFVSDGLLLRNELELDSDRTVWNLCMEEVWQTDPLKVRCDGGWCPRSITIAYKVPEKIDPRTWKIRDSALACGRIPEVAVARANRMKVRLVDASVFHFGWACKADRAARHQRYVDHDGGRFHASKHLDSIMWDDARVILEARDWPAGLDGVRERLTARATRGD